GETLLVPGALLELPQHVFVLPFRGHCSSTARALAARLRKVDFRLPRLCGHPPIGGGDPLKPPRSSAFRIGTPAGSFSRSDAETGRFSAISTTGLAPSRNYV